MIVRVTLDRPVPGLVTRDDPHGATFSREDGYIIEERGAWIRLTHETAPGIRCVPVSRIVCADWEDDAPPVPTIPDGLTSPAAVAELRAKIAADARGAERTEKAKGKR